MVKLQNYEKLKSLRKIVGATSKIESNKLCVFVGLFNASKYLEDLKSNMQAQDCNNCHFLVVDNCSTDDTWDRIQDWIVDFKNRITLVRNPLNLGATGSQWLNQDLLTTEWFTFMHQDDRYKRNHLSTLDFEIQKSEGGIVAIFTAMGSIAGNGRRIASLPRQAILVPDDSQTTAFLSSLRQHFVSWPSAAFRSSTFKAVLPPWHSTAFPDTELIMLLSAYGKFKFINKETMMYREHSASESHSTGYSEAQIGMCASLARIFASSEFNSIAQKVPIELRTKFQENLISAIKIRIVDKSLNSIVQLIAIESLAQAWEYGNYNNLAEIKKAYNSLGILRVENLIDSLMEFSDFPSNVSNADDFKFDFLRINENEMNLARLGFARKLYNLLGLMFPKFFREFIFKLFIRNRVKNKIDSPWNFEWK